MSRNGPWIITRSCKEFCLADPRPEDICIEDIAYALAGCVRWTGHSRMSVAQHSVLTSFLVPPPAKLHALMHDAHEAYIGDASRPLKILIPQLRELAHRLDEVIYTKFNIELFPEEVDKADAIMLITEAKEFFALSNPTGWGMEDVKPVDRRIYPWTADMAERVFIRTFKNLTNG